MLKIELSWLFSVSEVQNRKLIRTVLILYLFYVIGEVNGQFALYKSFKYCV